MSEVNVEPSGTQVNPVGTPPPTPEEVAELQAAKAQLESEISGLEGTKTSILADVERARTERRTPPVVPPVEPAAPPTPPVDVEALKAELEAKLSDKIAAATLPILESQAQMAQELIASKKVIVQSITERMAAASGSGGPASPESITESEVVLSAEEAKIAQELGIKNPRYMRDTEVTAVPAK